jgi:threonine/homoserine/homoserine lactone efflux protein
VIDLTLVPIFVAAVFMLMIIPGPDMVFVTANALGGGVRAGLAAMLGVASGAYLHVLAAAFGISAILQTSQTAYDAVRLCGAAYLAYLGIRFLRSRSSVLEISPAGEGVAWKIYRQGVITNLFNPKAALFTLSFVPQFVSTGFGPVWSQMLILGLIIVAIMIAVELPIVLASGRFSAWLAKRSGASRLLDKAIGLILLGLAAYIAAERKPV